MGPGDLSRALAALPVISDPRLLVGRETFDDAGVFLLSVDLALVQTVDFFAPIVDDPFDFGQVAAANALSDVYAMGGQPLTELKYGLAVTGRAHPNFLLTNAGAKPGDQLILTKPIGNGILATAGKRGQLSADAERVMLD